MPNLTPAELLSSITEDYINSIAITHPDAHYNSASEVKAANYIRIIRIAPTFLKFIKDSIYICTKKYSGNYITMFIDSPCNLTSDDFTYKTLNDQDEIIDVIVDAKIISKTEKMFNTRDNLPESWGNISKSKISCFIIEKLFKEINTEHLEILKSTIQPNLVSAEEWEAALILTKKYNIEYHYVYTMNINLPHFNLTMPIDTTTHDVVVAAQEIAKIVSDGDIVVFVGNTPQLIRYPFEKIITRSKENVKAVSLAISGHPDQIQERVTNSIITNILTDESHAVYKEYMQHMGITTELIKDHKIHLIDAIGYGGGLAYLIRCMIEIANDITPLNVIQHIDVIALNEIDWNYAKFNNQVEHHDLKMDKLTKVLDRVTNNDLPRRLMPSAHSYKWTPEFVKQIEQHSMHVFDKLNPFFTDILREIDMEMLGEATGQLHEIV